MSLIFAVDDSALGLNALSRILGAEGHQVICLRESVAAMDMIEEARPDLLLLDIVMPKVSGLELLREVRAREALATMPVIMVTAQTGAKAVSEALEAGAFDYIRKPFEAIEVVARVKSALRTKEYMERLIYLSERDGLTGLLNHATILREIEKELVALKEPGDSLALVMCDIDFFKRVNDERGHQAGDAVLAGLGKLLIEARGATGRAGRYGGEEFCVSLRGFDRAMAVRWAETLRGVVERRTWNIGGAGLELTMSFGISCAEGPSSRGSREFLADADRRLYAAKAAGRNRVVAEG